MCLIAYVPAGKTLPMEHVYAAARQNDDGIGIMSIDGVEKFVGHKMLKKARRYLKILHAKNAEFAIHFRYATHGDVNLDNCHPHTLPNHAGYLMHNGVLNAFTAKADKQFSDTALFTQTLVDPLLWTDPDTYLTQVAKDIGTYNKLCIMDWSGKFYLINEPSGTWKDGLWYSQTYSLYNQPKPRTVVYTPTNTTYPEYKHRFNGASYEENYNNYYDRHYTRTDTQPIGNPVLPASSHVNPDRRLPIATAPLMLIDDKKKKKYYRQYNEETGKYDLVDEDGMKFKYMRYQSPASASPDNTVTVPATSTLPRIVPVGGAEPKPVPMTIVEDSLPTDVLRAREALERHAAKTDADSSDAGFDPGEVPPGPWNGWISEEKEELDKQYAALERDPDAAETEVTATEGMLPGWSEVQSDKSGTA